MASKFMKVWNVWGTRKAVKASKLQDLKEKGIKKLDMDCVTQDVTVYLEDGTEVDDEEIFEVLAEGTVFFLCKDGEHPSQIHLTSPVPVAQPLVFPGDPTPFSPLDPSVPSTSKQTEVDFSNGRKRPWPKIFEISFHRFSTELETKMAKGVSFLDWQARHEIMNVIAEDILQFTLHPDVTQRKQVALCLLEKFPRLKSDLGDGLSGWAQRIYEKMKDVRAKLGTPEARAVRKRKSKSGYSVNVPHRGETNFFPKSCLSKQKEDELVGWMKNESRKPCGEQDFEKMKECMMETFASRRRLFNEKILTLSQMKDTFPLLFTSVGISTEFVSLQQLDPDELFHRFKECAEKIIHEAEKKKSKHKMDDEPQTFILSKRIRASEIKEIVLSNYQSAQPCSSEQTVTTAFLLLPFLLFENPDCIYKMFPEDTSLESIPDGILTPVLVFVGNPLQTDEIYICGEGGILMEVATAVDGIRDLFCTYYACNIEYPSSAVCTFLFLQNYLLKLHYSRKLPGKLVNLLDRM